MSRGSISIDVRCEVSVDVGWEVSVDGRVVSVDGGRRVSVDKQVLLLIDSVCFCLRIEGSKRAISEKRSVCFVLLLVLLGMHLKDKKIVLSDFASNTKT